MSVVVLMHYQIQKGSSSARSDDTKSLKGAVLDWITPRGQPLNPPLARNVKIDRGFHHERTGFLLCPAGMNWSDPVSGQCFRCLSRSRLILPRVKENIKNGDMVIPGDQWPVLLYARYEYSSEDPWKGLVRSSILVS